MNHFTAILALATGVLPLGRINPNRFVVFVKHAGPPVEFELFIRERSSTLEPWHNLEKIQHYPKRLKTSPSGTRVTVVRPPDLQRYSQICSLIRPGADPASTSSFQVLWGLQSCANLPKLKT